MTADSEISRAEVTKKSAEVQSIMADAKKEQDIADDKAKFIQQESAKIEVESKIAKKLADDADHELAKAEPSLIAANDAVNSLDKKYIAEMKALNKPPEDVATVMGAVMVFLQKDTSWAASSARAKNSAARAISRCTRNSSTGSPRNSSRAAGIPRKC